MRTVAKVQPTYYQESRLLLVKLQPTFPPRVAACSRLAAPAAASRVPVARRSRAHPLRCVHTCLQAAARPDPAAGTRPAAACHVRACLRAAGVLRSGYVDVQVADTEQPIAAPAWLSSGTRPPLSYLCVLRTVHAAGSGFRRRHRALCAGRCTLGRLFGLRGAARPRARRYAIAHGIRDKVHATNSWQSSRTCAVPMLQVLRMGWNCDAVRQISRYFGRETMHTIHES